MRIRGVADDVRIECEEDGFWLDVTTDEGDEIQVRLPQDVALQLETRVRETIGEWRLEGEAVRRELRASAEDDLTGEEAWDDALGDLSAFLDSGAADLMRDRARGK